MPLHYDRQAISAHHFFRLLQHTSEMFIYYNTEPDELGGGEPSRFVLQLKHELAQLNPRLEIKESLFVQPVKATFNERIITIHKCDKIMEQLRRKAEKGLSPTALSRFVECPLKFYLHDIAEIREKDKVDFNIAANVLGSVIHKCLENLYQPYLHQTIDHKSVEEMMTRLQNEMLIAFQAELPDTNFAEGRSRIAMDVAKKLVQQLLQFELNQDKSSQQSIYIIDLEKKLETIIQIKNIGVKLHGIIDRIDSLNGLTRIIDYKTGVTQQSDVKVADWTELKTHEKAKAFQLSVYQYMWAKNNASSEQQHVLSGLYSLRKMSEGLITTHYAMTQNKDEVLEQTEIIIKEILSEILESASPFVQTDSVKICERCSYIALCLRDK
jgi:ATP-dependent helicase/nuclease subunit B